MKVTNEEKMRVAETILKAATRLEFLYKADFSDTYNLAMFLGYEMALKDLGIPFEVKNGKVYFMDAELLEVF